MLAYVLTVNLSDGVAHEAVSVAFLIFIGLLAGVPAGLAVAVFVMLIA